ncbi:BQ2448_7973 [Microbotryum intermedium]|uniref:26S proteasome regulatory subunit RPN2 n=1 Tax=Microbotryum intermedium TaxID=269621 RepID=A0A238FSW2_9BASI|nr:BQ2448_7973 [Microbotryum intermedium]
MVLLVPGPVAGLLSLLDEPDATLQAYALQQINRLIHTFWAEVADHVVKIESLSETPSFPSRAIASLIASKVYYHLGNFDEALSFALGAGKWFNLEGAVDDQEPTEAEYIETIIAQAIDAYVDSRAAAATATASTSTSTSASTVEPVDARLEAIVERMFERCERDGEFKQVGLLLVYSWLPGELLTSRPSEIAQALGIALSSHRLDVIERIFAQTKNAELLEWILQIVVREGVISGSSRAYKTQVLNLLLRLFNSLPSPDYFSVTQCFVYLNDPSLASDLLSSLLCLSSTSPTEPSEEAILTAYQIAFDLAETATQEFLETVRNSLTTPTATAEAASIEASAPKEGKELHRERVISILTGEETIKLYLEFLYRNNHADLLILKGTKDVLDGRQSVYHSAVTFMNAFANAGTTSDQFLRENLDWLQRASNWSKFSATAALGVIHKGNLTQGKAILEPYLPRPGTGSSSFYSEGGSLYALGLVHANHGGAETTTYLKDALKAGIQNEVIQHGAALGLGVSAMGSGSEEIYDELRNVLFNDSAIAGEASGYAMGLVMLGTASEKALDEMLQYAHETQHEKIIRGLAVGISFLMYGKEEEADGLVETLLGDADPILRYGGIQTIAMAYAGTGNNRAIRKLLHVAVSDVNDDVRRAAVTSLGFLLFRNPTQVPRIVQLLSESYNPNVRYGAALALGISCAGTGLADAIELLEPLTKDPVDFVRQGACMSLAMILIQSNEVLNPKVASVRKIYEKIVADKHEDAMAKLGAALAQGIIDAGGRNVTLSMQNKSGSSHMPAIVGMSLFTQLWYWFPLAHCLSLAFTPTAIIAVDKDLRIPKCEFVSQAKPSLYAYVAATKPPTKETVEKVATAVLSTTAKTTARAKAKESAQADEAMETDDVKPSTTTAAATSSITAAGDDKAATLAQASTEDMTTTATMATMATTATEGADKTAPSSAKPKRREPTSTRLQNLSRVTPPQLSTVTFPKEARYVPVRPVSTLDQEPDKEAEFLEMQVMKVIDTSGAGTTTATGGAAGAAGASTTEEYSGPIADPPAPFEWTDWE